MASTTISGSGTRNNSGVALGVETSTSTMTALTKRNSCSNHNLVGTESKLDDHTESVLRSTAVAITAITQSASTGKVNIQKSTHGLAVGDKIMVAAADVAVYNRVHKVTVVTDANNVKTNVAYTTDTVSAHGSYYTVSGNFAKQTANKYVARVVCTELAGVANTTLRGGYVGAGSNYFNVARGNRKYGTITINHLLGTVSKSGDGTVFTYHDIQNNTTLAKEAYSTRAIPGRLTYRTGKSNPVSGSTPSIT